MTFERENQRVSATDILQEIARGSEIKLSSCTISGDLDINRLIMGEESFDTSALSVEISDEKQVMSLPQTLFFNSCTFDDNVCFAPPWDKPSKLEVVFYSDVHFNSSNFGGQSRFSKATFNAEASFDGCIFNHIAVYRNALFKGAAKFRTVAFEGYGLFDGSIFNDEARFTNTCFSRGGNFTNVEFRGKTDFAGVYSKSKSVPVYESVRFARWRYGEDETFWRFIKQASQEAGYYQLAGESFFNERCAHLCRKFLGQNFDELSTAKKIGRICWGIRLLPELLFGRLLFGYGERPVRVLVTSAIIILICAFFYISPSAEVLYRTEILPVKMKFMDGLYFSIITFTTLGFGDIYPALDHMPTKCVAMCEALSGACLMALFVVGLSKRFSRG